MCSYVVGEAAVVYPSVGEIPIPLDCAATEFCRRVVCEVGIVHCPVNCAPVDCTPSLRCSVACEAAVVYPPISSVPADCTAIICRISINEFDKKAGALEIIKVDGDQYIVDSSFSGDDKSKSEDCLKYLEEFNQLNKFKPIKIDKAS